MRSPAVPKVTGEKGKGSREGVRFPRSEDRAKQANAGTAETGGQRQGYPKLIGAKTPQDNPG